MGNVSSYQSKIFYLAQYLVYFLIWEVINLNFTFVVSRKRDYKFL